MSFFHRSSRISLPLRGKFIMGGRVELIPKNLDLLDTQPTHDPKTGWTYKSRRVGLIAKKVGMKTVWNEWGVMMPVTILSVRNNHVTQVKTEERDGFYAVQVGAGLAKLKNVTRQMMGHFANANVPPKQKLMEFRVTEDALVPIGTKLNVLHFLPGQKVDVQAYTKGKGTQGVMKRWGFSGQNASHGVSVTHRSLGSVGNRKDPGKVWKGKKMPGRMGHELRTVKSLIVHELIADKGLILVKGAVPGPNGCWVRITDATFSRFNQPPPFPTFVGNEKPTGRLVATYPKPWSKDLEDPRGESEEEYKKIIADPEARKKAFEKWWRENHEKVTTKLEDQMLSLEDIRNYNKEKSYINKDSEDKW